MKRLLGLLLLLCPLALQAQSITGVEYPINSFTGSYVSIVPPNTPATSLSSPFGQNTFIIPISSPTVAIRIYITNNTANACLGTLTMAMFAVSDTTTTTFNGSLANWSSIPIQTSSGLSTLINIDIPASQSIYIMSTAITAPRVAVQLVNPTGGCASTNLEVFGVVTQVSVTAPLISNSNGAFNSGLTANVQGIISTGSNGNPVFPVIGGGLQPALNPQTFALGVDTTSSAVTSIPASQSSFTTVQTPPPATGTSGYAVAVIAINGWGIAKTLNAPFNCITGTNPCSTSNNPAFVAATLASGSLNNLSYTYTTTPAGCTPGSCAQFGHFVVFKNTPSAVRNGNASNNITSIGTGAVLAGSTLLVSVDCSTLNCTIAPTDTQGLSWKPVATTSTSQDSLGGTLAVTTWIAGPTVAGADTITYNVVSGTIQGGAVVELAGINPAALNQPSAPLLVGGAANSTGAPPSGQLQTGGVFTSYSPAQLGANAITLPASASTALTNIIDMRGVKQMTLVGSCTQVVNNNITVYAEDGTTVMLGGTIAGSTGASANILNTMGSESTLSYVSGGTNLANLKFPLRALSFSWTNTTATPGTCTARLFLSY
jgi:hypothetical protein